MINQRQKILEYIRKYGSITSLEATIDLGITQLGARIFELKREGYEFKTEAVKGKNRYGEPTYYLKYYLVGDMIQDNMEHIPVIGG